MTPLETARAEWSREWCSCFLCGYTSFSGRWLDTHEIARGPHRKRALSSPAAWLRLCNGFANGCHERVGSWSIAAQLALKQLGDPEHYDRIEVCRLRRRADTSVTDAEVAVALRELLREWPILLEVTL